jgi:hypothetical protein
MQWIISPFLRDKKTITAIPPRPKAIAVMVAVRVLTLSQRSIRVTIITRIRKEVLMANLFFRGFLPVFLPDARLSNAPR